MKKNRIIKTILIMGISVVISAFTMSNKSNAITTSNSQTEDIEEIIEYENDRNIDKDEATDTIINLISTINSEGINEELLDETIDLYTEVSKEYTNKEIADIIDENKSELIKNGLSTEDINSITNVLRKIDENKTKKILEKIDVQEIYKQIKNGSTVQEIIKYVSSSLTITEKIDLISDLFLSREIINKIIIALIILFIYRTLLRCVIYKKAGKKPWAAFVPIYRNVTMLKICTMSPWWLLLLLVPIVGWAFLWVVYVASRFMLAENFGKGPIFAFGLWLLAPIFETILVFSWKTKYIEEDEIE